MHRYMNSSKTTGTVLKTTKKTNSGLHCTALLPRTRLSQHVFPELTGRACRPGRQQRWGRSQQTCPSHHQWRPTVCACHCFVQCLHRERIVYSVHMHGSGRGRGYCAVCIGHYYVHNCAYAWCTRTRISTNVSTHDMHALPCTNVSTHACHTQTSNANRGDPPVTYPASCAKFFVVPPSIYV